MGTYLEVDLSEDVWVHPVVVSVHWMLGQRDVRGVEVSVHQVCLVFREPVHREIPQHTCLEYLMSIGNGNVKWEKTKYFTLKMLRF